jgi:hypothetical protein
MESQRWGAAMMGRRIGDQASLFYEFRLDDRSTELSCPDDVRFTPDSDQTLDIPIGELRAKF